MWILKESDSLGTDSTSDSHGLYISVASLFFVKNAVKVFQEKLCLTSDHSVPVCLCLCPSSKL
jgi:hypothetical protein